MYFWDLARLTAYDEFKTAVLNPERDRPIDHRPSWLTLKGGPRKDAKGKGRDLVDMSTLAGSVAAGSVASTPVPADTDTGHTGMAAALGIQPEVVQNWESMYDLSHSHNHPLKPHRTITLSEKQNFKANHVAWSPGGDWCVLVGDFNRACFFQRWAGDKPPFNV